MEKRCIMVQGGPPAMGPYSHAVVAGDFLFVSGQGPFAADGSGIVRGTIEEESRATLDNLKLVLEGSGSSLDRVVKTTVFLADMDHFKAFNAVYAEYFPENCPARTCIQAGRLPGGIQVEVEAVALVSA